MNKNTLIIGVVIAIILAAGAVFMLRSQSQTAPQLQTAPETTNGTSTGTSETSQKQSLKDFMKLAGTQQCTFSDAEAGTSGTVFSSNGKSRTDFSSTVNGKVTTTHMISDRKNFHMWTDGMPSGFSMPMATIENMDNTVPAGIPAPDINKQVDYRCSPWIVSASMFETPQDMQFMDFSSMMPSIGAPTNDTQSGCATCDSLPPESQGQCKIALRCP